MGGRGLADVQSSRSVAHAARRPEVLDVSAEAALTRLGEAGVLPPERATRLAAALRRYRAVQSFLRLTVGGDFDESAAPEGLRAALARAAEAESFEALKETLAEDFAAVHAAFTEMIEAPARDLGANLEGD